MALDLFLERASTIIGDLPRIRLLFVHDGGSKYSSAVLGSCAAHVDAGVSKDFKHYRYTSGFDIHQTSSTAGNYQLLPQYETLP